MKTSELSVILGLALAVLITSFWGFSTSCDEIRDKTLRLHIVANSDSEQDQAVKLKIRDNILLKAGDIFTAQKSKNEAAQDAKKSLTRLKEIAKETLAEKDLHYDVDVYTTKMYFATTRYENFTMPAGEYDAVRLELGESSGKNWWCVLFPPLCIPSASGKAEIEAIYNTEEIELISTGYDLRFAALETILQLKQQLQQK